MATQTKIPWKKIHALRGILKRQPGDKSFAEEWAEHKSEEMELEEGKLVRVNRAGLFPATRNSSRSKKKLKLTG
jgi:hypothetical protein